MRTVNLYKPSVDDRVPVRFKAHLSETYIFTYEFQLKSNELLKVEEEK